MEDAEDEEELDEDGKPLYADGNVPNWRRTNAGLADEEWELGC